MSRTIYTLLLMFWIVGGVSMTAAAAPDCPGSLAELCDGTLFQSDENVLTGQPGDPATEPTLNALLSNLFAGNPVAATGATASGGSSFPSTVVHLNPDPCDGFLADCVAVQDGPGEVDERNALFGVSTSSLNQRASQAQKGILGCGEPFGVSCVTVGIGISDATLSGLFQSWIDLGVQGPDFDTTSALVAQPGTVGAPPPGCSGAPGCRGPVSASYDPALDGCAGPGPLGCNAGDPVPLGGSADGDSADGLRDSDARTLFHPLAGLDPGANGSYFDADDFFDCDGNGLDDAVVACQAFSSELAALSWNAMMTALSLSGPSDDDGRSNDPDAGPPCEIAGPDDPICFDPLAPDEATDDPTGRDVEEFNAAAPFRTDGCSFARPQFCAAVRALLSLRPECSDGIDNDGDTFIDYEDGDTGCESADDLSERSPLHPCDDGVSNDLDGLVDFPADPGCAHPIFFSESPQCDDGEDNDSDGSMDMDDSDCAYAWQSFEAPLSPCGFGFELAFVLPALTWHFRRRRG